jgi:NitT/TauT family transport system permease protein
MDVVSVKPRQFHPPHLDFGWLVDRLGPGTVGLLIGAIAWEVFGRITDLPFFPPLSAVLERLVELTLEGKIIGNVINSVVNLAIGFSVAALIGIPVGMAMGAYRKVEMALDFYVYALLTAPSLVFAPLFFSMFGAANSRLTVIAVIVMYTVFIVIVNTQAAIRNVPRPLVEMGRSFNATERQQFRRVIIPASLPLTMAGLRLGMGRSVKGMINGEMFVAIVGLGEVVTSSGERFDAEGVLAVLIVIIAIAMVAVKIIQIVDLRLTSWLPSNSRQRRRNG